jgi:hypothetical protein
MRKIKFNWGTGIAIFIALFLLSMIVLIFLASRIEVDLVNKEYYPQGLRYQDDIDRMENYERLGQEAQIKVGPDSVVFTLPPLFSTCKVQGNIELYRPSDAGLDIRDSLPQNGRWSIPINQLSKGRYELKASWTCEGVDYFMQKNLIIE